MFTLLASTVKLCTGTDSDGGCWCKESVAIRVLIVILLGALLIACKSGNAAAPSTTLTSLPTATITVATPTPTVIDPLVVQHQADEATMTAVELTPEIDVSVPKRKEEDVSRQAPNPELSPRDQSGPNEVLGANLTIYNCIGENGGYCPGVSHTASGTEVGPGTAACDQNLIGRKFAIVGDPTSTVWVCLDTGLFTSPLFDLWFYDLAVGRAYLNNLPYPYRIVFVD